LTGVSRVSESLHGRGRIDAGRPLRLPGAALVLLAVALVLVGAVGCRSSVETKVDFLRDWEAAKDQAASDNKPIMINFYTDT
jgi:hypothetical protein